MARRWRSPARSSTCSPSSPSIRARCSVARRCSITSGATTTSVTRGSWTSPSAGSEPRSRRIRQTRRWSSRCGGRGTRPPGRPADVPGIRARVALTLVALVAVTVTAIGVGVYAFVDASLRNRLIEDARQQVDYNLSALLPGADPRPTDKRAFAASGLPEAFALGGSVRVLADFGDGEPYEPKDLPGALAEVAPGVRAIVGNGQIGYAWQTMAGAPV